MKNTASLKTASIGSISRATLRTDHLLSACLSELEWQRDRNGDYFSSPENFTERDSLTNLIGEIQDAFTEDGEDVEDEETAQWILESAMNRLETFAPPYCYFGMHPGDGSDLGYWPSWDSIDELPQVEDGDEAKELGEDCKAVNCHGNVTVYGGDGSVILELV